MNNHKLWLGLMLMICCIPTAAKAQQPYYGPNGEVVQETGGVRARHWSGFDVGLGTTPFPSIGGGMLGFNVGDEARISAGIGNFSRWMVYQLDLKFFLSEAAWAMFIGTGINYLNGSQGNFVVDIQFDRGFFPYLMSGVDFQSEVGVHVAFQLGFAVPNGRVLVLPGVALGWYF